MLRNCRLTSGAIGLLLLLFVGCASQKEVVLPPAKPVPQPEVHLPPPPEPEPKPSKEKVPPAAPKRYRSSLRCQEMTALTFNESGLDVLPFVRAAFYDMDGDGIQEMIAGSKDGFLRLYRSTRAQRVKWEHVAGYFTGIAAGAFSAPSVGDIDNDGKPEIVLGTGGFSSDSGMIRVYKNIGTVGNPEWYWVRMPEIDVGDDATPSLADVDGDGWLDIVAGNSKGNLFLYRNEGRGKTVLFKRDADYFRGLSFGMYAAPAVTTAGSRVIVVVGNSMGKLTMIEKAVGAAGKSPWNRQALPFSFRSFAVPAFHARGLYQPMDLVVSDGDGRLAYLKNGSGTYREWTEDRDVFSGRILPGPGCAPAISAVDGNAYLVVGNINGEILLYEYNPTTAGLPWTLRKDFFRNIKLPGFSRGVFVSWQGKKLLITGQQDGILRAFLNVGGLEKPVWKEQKQFFSGLPKMYHAAPAVYDIDGDGTWELIVGDEEGYVRGFRYELSAGGRPAWKRIPTVFDSVKVERYATPSIIENDGKVYLFAGEQDGRIAVFAADKKPDGMAFLREDYLEGVQMNNHSSPTLSERQGIIEMSVGDYYGNLKHFACRRESVEVHAGASW